MKRRYRVTIEHEVTVTVDDEKLSEDGLDAVARTQTDDWRSTFYTLSEDEALGLLAVQIGIHNRQIERIDGWADMPEGAVDASDGGWSTTAVHQIGAPS